MKKVTKKGGMSKLMRGMSSMKGQLPGGMGGMGGMMPPGGGKKFPF